MAVLPPAVPSMRLEVLIRRDMMTVGALMSVLWLVVILSPDFALFRERSDALLQAHFALEMFSIIVSVMVAAFAARSFNHDRSDQSSLLWGGFALVAVFDALHLLAYDGMPQVLVPVGPDHAIFYWLLGRSVLALILLALALNSLIQVQRRTVAVAIVTVIVVAMTMAYLHRDGWPALYQQGRGVTALKSALEVIIALIYVSAGIVFWRDSRPDTAYRQLPLATACFVLAMGETLFTYYITPSTLSNIAGHLFKVVGYYMIYRAVFVDGIEEPYRALESASRALIGKESQLRALADNLPNGLVYVYTRDAAGQPKFLHVSRGVEQMHGFSAEAVMADAQLLYRQVNAEDLPKLAEAERRSRASMQPVQVQARFTHANGEQRVMLYSSCPRIDDMGQLIWEGLELDVTDAMRTREALELERARLRNIVDSSMDAIISVDGQYRIVLVNQAAEKLFQMRAFEMMGRPLEILMPERFRKNHSNLVDGYRRSGQSSRPMGQFMHVFGLRADGSEFPLEASIARLGNENNELLTVVLRDLTAKVEAENRRQKLEAQLQQSQKMEALGTLAGGIAHDFNNILAIINGNAGLALTEAKTEPAVQTALKEIHTAGQRGRDLIQRILTFSRLRQAHPEVLDVGATLEETRLLLRPTLPARVELTLAVHDAGLRVHMDRVALEQVMVNLCTNAWQAMPGGSGHVWISVRKEVWRGAGAHPHAVVIDVRDDGTGIPEELRTRIFDPFFTTKPAGEGTGLGLAMVHSLLTQADGRVDVASQPGQGTTFTLTLPGTVDAPPVEPSTALRDEPARPIHLLYVDDEQSLVFLMERGLKRLGHRISSFTDPREALAEASTGALAFDVALVDHNMPNLSGLELASALLRHYPERKVILTSGYVDSVLEEQARERGIHAVVYKPASMDDMLKVVMAALEPAVKG